jgi:hypothetical protein
MNPGPAQMDSSLYYSKVTFLEMLSIKPPSFNGVCISYGLSDNQRERPELNLLPQASRNCNITKIVFFIWNTSIYDIQVATFQRPP